MLDFQTYYLVKQDGKPIASVEDINNLWKYVNKNTTVVPVNLENDQPDEDKSNHQVIVMLNSDGKLLGKARFDFQCRQYQYGLMDKADYENAMSYSSANIQAKCRIICRITALKKIRELFISEYPLNFIETIGNLSTKHCLVEDGDKFIAVCHYDELYRYMAFKHKYSRISYGAYKRIKETHSDDLKRFRLEKIQITRDGYYYPYDAIKDTITVVVNHVFLNELKKLTNKQYISSEYYSSDSKKSDNIAEECNSCKPEPLEKFVNSTHNSENNIDYQWESKLMDYYQNTLNKGGSNSDLNSSADSNLSPSDVQESSIDDEWKLKMMGKNKTDEISAVTDYELPHQFTLLVNLDYPVEASDMYHRIVLVNTVAKYVQRILKQSNYETMPLEDIEKKIKSLFQHRIRSMDGQDYLWC